MKFSTLLSSGLLMTLLIGATAQAAGDPRKLGTQWQGPGDVAHITQLGLNLERPSKPDPDVYRHAEIDWSRSQLQVGEYPRASFSRKVEGVVGITVDIDAAGKPLSCRLTAASGAADLDAHACPHVMANIRFTPTLRRDGAVTAQTLAMTMDYALGPLMMNVPVDGPAPVDEARAAPITPITAETAGIAGRKPPRGVEGFGATLFVDPDGRPFACNLHRPTKDNASDKLICDSLLARSQFKPAERAPPRRHSFWMYWPS